MSPQQQKLFETIVTNRDKNEDLLVEYWNTYSNYSHWQFWFIVLLLLLPLIAYFIFVDKKRFFEFGFYGFSIHVLALYLDAYGVREGLWGYPYQLSPQILGSFALDASMIPVFGVLVYQSTYAHRSKFYVSTFLLCAFFSFIVKPIMAIFDLFWLNPETSYLELFAFYLGGFAIAILLLHIYTYFSKLDNGDHA